MKDAPSNLLKQESPSIKLQVSALAKHTYSASRAYMAGLSTGEAGMTLSSARIALPNGTVVHIVEHQEIVVRNATRHISLKEEAMNLAYHASTG